MCTLEFLTLMIIFNIIIPNQQDTSIPLNYYDHSHNHPLAHYDPKQANPSKLHQPSYTTTPDTF